MTRQTITLMPRTEKWFNNIIGALRKIGVKTSVSEFTNFVAWKAQRWVPDDPEVDVTEDRAEEYKQELEQFRAEMKALEGEE